MPKLLISGALAVVAAVSFVAFLALHSVNSRVATARYFADVLASSDVYRRLYDDLLADPEFAPEVDELLGGVDVKREDLVATVKQLVDPEYLEATANTLISHLVVHFDSDAHLDLSFDITTIVDGVHAVALQAIAQGLAAVPVRPAESYEAFLAEFEKVIGVMQGEGTLPAAIPTFAIPPEHQADVAAVLIEAGGLDATADANVIAAIEEAIARDDIAAAIRAASASLLERLIARSIEQLTHNAYVTRVDTRYMFGPTPEISAQIESKLATVRRLNRAAQTGRIVAALIFAGAIVGLVLIHRRRGRSVVLAWVGGTAIAAGAVAFITWYVVRGIAQHELVGVASSKSLPSSLRLLLGDVIRNSVADFNAAFWIPALGCLITGVALVVAARSRRLSSA